MRFEIPEGFTRLRDRKLQRTLWNYSVQEYHIVRIGQLEMKRKGEQFILNGTLLSHADAIKERGCRVPVL